MSVRIMSALPRRFSAEIGLDVGQQTNKNGPKRAVQFSPKAEVRGSNPLGRATFSHLLAALSAVCPRNTFSRRSPSSLRGSP